MNTTDNNELLEINHLLTEEDSNCLVNNDGVQKISESEFHQLRLNNILYKPKVTELHNIVLNEDTQPEDFYCYFAVDPASNYACMNTNIPSDRIDRRSRKERSEEEQKKYQQEIIKSFMNKLTHIIQTEIKSLLNYDLLQIVLNREAEKIKEEKEKEEREKTELIQYLTPDELTQIVKDQLTDQKKSIDAFINFDLLMERKKNKK